MEKTERWEGLEGWLHGICRGCDVGGEVDGDRLGASILVLLEEERGPVGGCCRLSQGGR